MYTIHFLTLEEAEEFLKERINVFPGVVPLFRDKIDLRVIYIPSVNYVQGNIIKQEALASDIDAAIPQGMIDATRESGPVLIIGDLHRIKRLIAKLKLQPYGLKKIAESLEELIEKEPLKFRIPAKGIEFDCRNPVIMGILNVTPDSFSDGGKYNTLERALSRVEEMIRDGADIIDVGGESTRPGASPVDVNEELKRTIPIIEEIRKRFEIPISIDTSKPEVAKRALEAGADIINDVTAAREPEMEKLIIETKSPVVLMHMQGEPRTMQRNPHYEDVIGEIYGFLKERVNFFVRNGLNYDQIAIDPGIGFGKTLQHNLTIFNHLDSFLSIGSPVLIGPSRKSFIGMILDVPVEEREEGTVASVIWSYMKGACIFRVHDVKENKRALEVAKAIKFSFSTGKREVGLHP